MIGNRFYTWFKNYYQWVGGAFNETLLLPLVRATAGLRAGAIRYDETTNTVETYDGANWNAIPSATGFVPNSRTITINGTTFDLSTNRIYTIPTHDAVTLGTANGLALNNQQLSLALAASGTTGALSAADWASFNAKQGAISLTTTGNSGASTFTGNVLNIPNYTISGLGGVPTSRNLSINGTQLDLSADRSWSVGTVTSVGLSMPAAFTVSGSPVTGSGTLAVTGAGLATQYVRGDGTLANFPTTQGGGSSVSYYLNGSVNQGTFGGATYYEMNRTPVLGAGTNFSLNTDGYIASFITDANDPALTEIPGGNFNLELYFSASSGGGTPTFYVELYKYDGTTFSLIASNSTSPDTIVGSAKDAYFTALAVPQTTLAITDRLAIRIYVSVAGRTITLHTEDQNLCQVITTFSTGINTINGLTKQVQFLTTGTSGTDFNINSTNSTHTFNIPTASATNRGALSAADWAIFNAKQNALTLTTTGNSGAATLVNSTLNIPQYTASGLGAVPTSRTLSINGTAFDLSANRSWSVGTVTSVGLSSATSGVSITDSPVTVSGTIGIAIATANGSQQGLLSSTDWTTFNNKQNTLSLTTNGTSGASTLIGATLNVPQYQAQGNYITSLTGEATASGPGAASVTLSTTAVTGKLLTGLNLSGGGTIAATDSILTAFGKVQNQISAMMGGVTFQGVWNASTNTPTLTSSTGTKGHYYIVDVSGTTNLNGITDWRVGDWAIFNGSTWDKVDNTDAVSSVNGFTGAVSLTTSHIAEGTNLYYTDTRARNAISLTTTGNSGAATYTAGVLNVPQYSLTGLGGVPSTRQLTINGTAFDLSADRSWNVGTVTSVGLNSTTSGVTITNTPVTGSGALTINIATASGSQQGLLSSGDWISFNNRVPYSGATSAVNLGTNNLLAANIDIEGSGTGGGMFSIKQYSSSNSGKSGYTSLFALNQNLLSINFSQSPSVSKTISFDVANISNNASITYQLPNASGTLALTSAVSGSTGQIAYFNGTNSVTGESNLFWDAANDRLTIGTSTSSGESVTVYGAAEAAMVFQNAASSTGTGNGFYIGLLNAENYIWTYESQPIVFGTSDTARMRLDASGNLGLGVTPSAWAGVTALQVRQGALFNGSNNNTFLASNVYFDGANFTYIGSAGASYYQQTGSSHIWLTAPSGTAGNAITFTQAMTLDASGRLGIGTTSPTLGKVVSKDSGFQYIAEPSDTSTFGYLGIGHFTNGAFIGTYAGSNAASDIIRFGTGGTERMRITSGGNVGIGTTAPVAVAGQTSLTINGANVGRYDIYVNGTHNAQFLSTTTELQIGSLVNIPFCFYSNGAERMRIQSDGNVGIGTTSTAHRLGVVVAGGADREILQAAVSGVSNGFRVQWNHANSQTRVSITDIPTSSAGLPAGTLYSDGGTIKIA